MLSQPDIASGWQTNALVARLLKHCQARSPHDVAGGDHSLFVLCQQSASFTLAAVFMKLRPPEYGKANRRDGDREGHDGIAGHQNDPPEVAGRLQPRFQDW